MSALFQVKTRLLLAVALLACAFTAPAQEPDARQILRSVRLSQASQHHTLKGRLRTGSKAIPFRLVIDGATIRYEFTDPAQAIVLRLGDKDARLTEVTSEGTEKVGGSKFDDKVRDSDISYEDLAMRFLYWPEARIEGEQIMILQKCWIIRVEPGSAGSQYGSVKLWIAKETGALLQAEAFDRAGKFARRFKVITGQKIGGAWVLKQMRIEAPGGASKDRTPTYLEVEGVEK